MFESISLLDLPVGYPVFYAPSPLKDLRGLELLVEGWPAVASDLGALCAGRYLAVVDYWRLGRSTTVERGVEPAEAARLMAEIRGFSEAHRRSITRAIWVRDGRLGLQG